MATMNVSLPDAMKDWVESRVGTGQYANASDYVRDLIRMDQKRAEAQAEFDRLVEEGINSPRISITAEDLLERVMAKAEAAVGARKSA
jgi:putative addiction module antidote protein, CC2985 family